MILDDIVRDKRIRLVEHKTKISESDMRKLAEDAMNEGAHTDDLFYKNMSKPGISIIGEFKQASPSLGKIESKINLMDRIDEYNECVDAISCLTEEDHFNGNVDYLKQIREKSTLPILRKDFMIEEYQFYEARAIGSDAVLLITAILDDAQMKDFYDLSRELGLGVLVETHDEYEIERALKIDPRIVGINNRNLGSFETDVNNSFQLISRLPAEGVKVSESGISSPEIVSQLRSIGYRGFLIGENFMKEPDPGLALANFIAQIR